MQREVMVQPREGARSGDTALLLETGPGSEPSVVRSAPPA